MSKEFITVDHSTHSTLDGVPVKASFIIAGKEGGTYRTAQLCVNPCRDFPPSFYEYGRRSNTFNLNKHEEIEAAFSAIYNGHFYPKKESNPFYEMSGKIYQGDKVVCLTRPQLIKEHENYGRFLRLSKGLGRSSYFNQTFIPPYENYTTKTDTAVYCTPYKYSVPGFYEYGDNTASVLYGIYKSLRLQVRVNEPAYFGTPFDLREHERLCEFKRNYCKDIKL